MVDELFVSLVLDRHVWLKGIERAKASLATEVSISERGDRQFEEGWNSKVKWKETKI